ncbi:putative immunoglobulin-blocking virulence protein [[Mycoplasma] imitans]|uniref:putative immunoglobulin-blocking virulence protein n=1 Tax=[Mycoplasma] imitans TaxID=29560 RepID=UPI0004872F18|nr:putative immunoglobulin-blocking virulence protein [[Mycoplasma] imitans]
MISSKKRKVIKLISLGTASVAVSAASTLAIVYSTYNKDSQANLIPRSDRVELDGNASNTNDSQASNRDFNLENAPKDPENKPIVVNPPEKKPDQDKQPPKPQNELAADTQIQYVTYQKQDYKLDKLTPQQPNDPSKQVLSDADAMKLLEKTKASLNAGREALLEAIAKGPDDTAARDAFRQASGYAGNEEFFNDIWKNLFTKTWNGIKFIDYLLQDVESALNDNNFLLSESKANRIWRINININHSINISFGYEKQNENPVLNYYKKVNEYKVLGSPDYPYNPTPDDIINGRFRGWDKTDVSNSYFNNEYGIGNDDGITVFKYSPNNKQEDYYKDKTDLNMFVLDVDNTSGYEKFINFIQKVYEKDPNHKIGVTLKNVGKTDTTRNVYDILKALPDNVETLTVFLEGADTTSLLALEDRHLRELNLYTTGQVNTDLWGINPLALKHINFIPSLLAYNVGGFDPYPAGSTIASTPIFTTLKFDRNDDYKRVQEGLDIAFDRRNERIFQGNFQGDGAKPVFWDFADAPIIRNLKNLNVHDAELRYVRLSDDLVQTDSNGNTYVTYDLSEFNHSQWTAAMRYRGAPGDKLEISFGRGTGIQQPNSLVLRGAQNTLEHEGLSNLLTFVKYATNSGAFRNVYVSSQYLADQIKAAAASEQNYINVKVLPLETLDKNQLKVFEINPNVNAIGEPIKKTS